MNKYPALKIFLLIFLIIILSLSLTAYTPNWEINFENQLDVSSDGFTAGAGSPAKDSYDPSDIIQPPSKPSGVYIEMWTLVDEQKLTADYRTELEIGESKTWEITLIAYDPSYQPISGLNTLTWSLENTENFNLELIDYGNDKSRTNIVGTINPEEEPSYEFDVTSALGPYLYLDLVVEKTESEEEPPSESPPTNPGGGSSGGGGTRCVPSWRCTDWSECSKEGTQTRTCTDKNNCRRTNNKPSEKRTCAYTAPTTPQKKTPKEVIEKETSQQKTENPDTTKITGAAVAQTTEPSILVGFLIIIVIIGLGLTIFFLITKK